MRKLLYIGIMILSMVVSYSCGNQSQMEENESDINVAMLHGREAGRVLVSREWKDTMQLQYHILEAKAKQSKYLMEGKTQCADAFDRGFVSIIRCVNPQLATLIFTDSLLNK